MREERSGVSEFSRRNFLKGAAVAGAAGMLGLVGCSNSDAAGESQGSSSSGGVDKEIIVTSFGTTYDNSRHITIGAVEDTIREAFPDWKVQRAFTAQDIIDKLAAGKGIGADGEYNNETITIMNFDEALDDAKSNGVKTLVVMPTHLTEGAEYQDVKNSLGKVSGDFEQTAITHALLNEDSDFRTVANAIHDHTLEYNDGKTAMVFMGHGNGDMGEASDKYYEQFQATIDSMESENPDFANYFICTVEGSVQKEDAYALMQATGTPYTRVVLEDLMVVCGDHANNDMAGDEDSLKTYFQGMGYEVVCILDGLGQMLPIDELYKDHLRDTLEENGLA